MKILNLYCGIGGNRNLWSGEHEVTAVEIDSEIAAVYQELFPNDKVIVTDAHQYLLEHYKEFDFIWSSPPCQTHSKLRYCQKQKVFPDMKIYQEITFLSTWFKGNWAVENVVPYYTPLIPQKIILGRHMIWSNYNIQDKEFSFIDLSRKNKEEVAADLQMEIPKCKNSRQLIRNCVDPLIGLHILNCSQITGKKTQTKLGGNLT